MTTQSQPPINPFDDEDGYYPRDPKSVLTRTDEQFRVFVAHLSALAEGIEAVSAVLPPDQQSLGERLRNELRAVQGDNKLLLALVRELAFYNIQLNQQRQSARAAYNQGTRDTYTDILSQLHPEDQRMLRWIIKHLQADDNAADNTEPY